jgi:hypothetical protein
MPPNILNHDAAVLIWLLPDQKPDIQNLDRAAVVAPPTPNPEPWWNVRDAIFYAAELAVDDRHGKVPWIKWGHELLSPQEITDAYQRLKAG